MRVIISKKGTTRRVNMVGLAAGVLSLAIAGCKSKDTSAPIVGPDGGDPAAANMAQPYTGGSAGGYNVASASVAGSNGSKVRVLSSQQAYQGQVSGQDYQNYQDNGDAYGQGSAAPIIRQAPAAYAGDPYAGQGAYNQGYSDAEEAGEQAIAETDQAPPPLPEYDQPPAPDPNYLWTPGYYDYASSGYYFVPGAWVAPPFYGALWTPPWWGFYGNQYRFHRGYWGSHVGFYGGIDYGFGYIGTGYYGGYWRGHDFYYNRAVTNVNVTNVHNVYDRTVIFNNRAYGARPDNRVSFNGGHGGIQARPTPSELGALHEARYAPVAAQRENRLAAASNRGQFVRADGGHPAMAFAARPIGNAGNIGNVPREQPLNHPNVPGVSGRPETGTFQGGREAAGSNVRANSPAGRNEAAPAAVAGGPVNRGFAGAEVRPGEVGHGTAGASRQAGLAGREAVMGSEARRGAEGGHNAPNGTNGGFSGQARPSGNAPHEINNAHPPAGQIAPEGRLNAGPQRQAPMERQSAPAFHPEAAPAARPPAPQQRAAPTAAPQNSAPAPHANPATPHIGGGGGGEHGGHH